MSIKSVLVAAALGVACSVSAKTVYVNCQFESYAGHDGSTPEKALRTIQEGINKALSNGDTVSVAPGVYNEGFGGAVKSWGPSRIGWNNRGINIIAESSNPADTVIVGERSSETPEGYGEGGMRCISVYNGGGSVVKGFTLRNGHTESTAVKDALNAEEPDTRQGQCCYGGAVCVDSQNFTVADCIIEDCSGENYGALYQGTYVRCRVTKCTMKLGGMLISSYGPGETARVRLYCCVIDNNFNSADYNTNSGIMIYNTSAYNCTIVNNFYGSCCYSAGESFYNCIFWNSGGLQSPCTYVNCVRDSDEPRPILSTIHADERLLPGSSAITAGDAANLAGFTLSEEAARFVDLKDFGGNTLPTEGTIAAGANQTVVTPVAGGIASGNGNVKGTCVDGYRIKNNTPFAYAFPTVYPTQYVFSAVVTDPTKKLSYFQFAGNYKFGYDYRYPDMNDRLYVMPPADPNVTFTNNSTSVQTICYLKPDADETIADGTAEKPYRTFAAAIAKFGSARVYVAKAGTYAEGVVENDSIGRARMLLGGCYRVTSEEGPEKTIIVGEKDTSETGDEYGRGPKAVRAVMCNANMPQLQGFTLTGCYSDKPGTGLKAQGGASKGNDYTHIDDCIVTNNCAGEGGAIYGGWAARTYIADNHGTDYVVSSIRCCGCVIENNTLEHPVNGIVGSASWILHTDVLGERVADAHGWGQSSNIRRYASIFQHGDTARNCGPAYGNIYNDFITVADTTGGIADDPLFADPANGDWHPFVRSPVFSCGVEPTAGNYGSDYCCFATTDFEGNPIEFIDGKPIAGAFMNPTTKRVVAIDAARGGISVTTPRIVLNENDSVTIEEATGTRPCSGVTVDGEPADLPLTIAAADAVGGISVKAVYSNKWYVDANNGNDDTNTGFTPETAKKTLASVLNPANLLPGDIVYAAEGLYNEGEMKADPADVIRSRAIVPQNVSLIATGARERTIIEGQAATTLDPYKYAATDDMRGMGADAIRGVLLSRGAVIKGFTVRNGFARAADAAGVAQWDNNGGGIAAYEDSAHGNGRNACTAEDCFVTNCAAFRGGGVFGVKCVRCILVDNLAVYGGGATSDSYLYGCLTKDNKAHFPWGDAYCGHLWNYLVDGCTIMDGIITANAASNPKLINTVISGAADLAAVPFGNVLSCVIAGTPGSGVYSNEWMEASIGTVVVPAAEIFLDENGAPIPGKSPALERANLALSTYEITDKDVYGNPRVTNGAQDSGAVEANWLPRYSLDLHKRVTTVTAASPMVQEVGDAIKRIQLVDGTTLTVTVAPSRHAFGIPVSIQNGLLSLSIDGEEPSAYSGEYTITLDESDVERTLQFSFAANAEAGDKLATIGEFKSQAGAAIFLR